MAQMSINIPDEDRVALESFCKEDDRNLSWEVRKAVSEYIKNRTKKEDESQL